jgi:hypothetical protein
VVSLTCDAQPGTNSLVFDGLGAASTSATSGIGVIGNNARIDFSLVYYA